MTRLSEQEKGLVTEHLFVARNAAKRATRIHPGFFEDAYHAAVEAMMRVVRGWDGRMSFRNFCRMPCLEAAYRHTRSLLSPVHSPLQRKDAEAYAREWPELVGDPGAEPSYVMPDPDARRLVWRLQERVTSYAPRSGPKPSAVSPELAFGMWCETESGPVGVLKDEAADRGVRYAAAILAVQRVRRIASGLAEEVSREVARV